MNREINKETLNDLAYAIHFELYGKPKTHKEWADGFNVRGQIKRTIRKYFNNPDTLIQINTL